MAPKFGTSGLRGLVVELTEAVVTDYVTAFLANCDTGGTIYVGYDLRESSLGIAEFVHNAARAIGIHVVDCGAIPTPALALAADKAKAGAIMVTGSHIPADRNGLKFYTTRGEILKDDETLITLALGQTRRMPHTGLMQSSTAPVKQFIARYVGAFGPALAGRRIGVYTHSAVGRDVLMQTLAGLGAEVVELARSDVFIPVDTEALDPDTAEMLAKWARDHNLDAIASTDGDSDRPMLTDETGTIIAGDILGQITSQELGATVVVTPISSNSGVHQKRFGQVVQTQIGSPYVIAGMAQHSQESVVGYEANGGYLLGFTAQGPAGSLPPLTTRDSFLPIIVPLIAAQGRGLSERVAQEPRRYTAADRLQDIPTKASAELVTELSDTPKARAEFLQFTGSTSGTPDLTDGIRMHLENGAIVHVRPSGNAPELRLYVEADSPENARTLLHLGLDVLRQRLVA